MIRGWAIFVITSFNFFLSQFYRASNAVIAPQLIQDLGLDTAGLGLMSAAFFYAFACTQIPLAMVLDRIGPRRMMTGLSIAGIAGVLLFAWAPSLHSGIVGRALMGVGMACNMMGPLKLLTVWFPPSRFATLSGIIFSIGFVGNMAATTPLVVLVGWLGWRTAFTVIGGINGVLVVLLYWIVRDTPPIEGDTHHLPAPSPGARGVFHHIWILLAKRDYWIISMGTFVGYGSFAAFQALWAGPYLIEAMGLSPFSAGNVIFMVNLGLIIGSPLLGALSDKVFKTRKWMILAGLIFVAATMLVLARLPFGTGIAVLMGIFFFFGLVRASSLLMYAHIKELMPVEMSGAAMTGINFFTMMGPAVFLQGLGLFMQTLHPEASRGLAAFQAAFILCAVCLGIAGLAYFFTRESQDKDLVNRKHRRGTHATR